MNSGGYKIKNKKEIHFLSFAVVEWVDVFTRRQYKDIVVESLRYCQLEKGLLIHAWCLMSNHMHLIVSSKTNDLSDIIRDFKKFTAKKIIAAIENNENESRKDWMLSIFKSAGSDNSRNKSYQFWRQDNQPKEMFSAKFSVQKLNYVHNNPVEAGLVEKPEDYLYSSARSYKYGKDAGLLPVEFI